MNKIASPRDLHRELNALLAYAQTEAPSRVRLASALNELAERVATSVANRSAKKRTDAEYQDSEEYKTDKDRDYYPKKAPAGMKYPSEFSSLGAIKSTVMSMFEEDLDKDRAYRHPTVKKLQKALGKRMKTEKGVEEVRAEMRQIEDLKDKMVHKSRDSKSDAEGDPYRFAARKLYHAWQGYNAAVQDYGSEQ